MTIYLILILFKVGVGIMSTSVGGGGGGLGAGGLGGGLSASLDARRPTALPGNNLPGDAAGTRTSIMLMNSGGNNKNKQQ